MCVAFDPEICLKCEANAASALRTIKRSTFAQRKDRPVFADLVPRHTREAVNYQDSACEVLL